MAQTSVVPPPDLKTEGLRIAVTGASGLLGSALSSRLRAQGHDVVPLVRPRGGRPAGEGVAWRPGAGEIDAAALEGVDAVVHLAGEPIDQRWTPAAKQRILESRRDGTGLLASALAEMQRPPRVFVSQSAVGYYGDRGDTPLAEEASSGDGFLAEVVRVWEAAAEPARRAGIRVVHPRTGIVLSRRGGALGRMLLPFRLGLGGPVAGGAQWLPWIAEDDWVRAVHHLILTPFEGPVNVAAPQVVRQREFAHTLGRVLHRPALAPLPKPAVRLLFGQMGVEALTYGQRVEVRRLEASGFRFDHPDLEGALRAVLPS